MGPYEAAEALKERLQQQQEAHRRLDDLISEYVRKPAVDQLFLKRLKKRKLAIKDEIAYLMNALNPDIIA